MTAHSGHSGQPGRFRRSADGTRAAILEAARQRFISDGYKRATIRAIAADAGIDPAMVMRYYGNKELLFAAAIDVNLGIPDLTTIPRSEVGDRLVRFFVERWEHDETLIALLRSAATNEVAATDRMRDIFAKQVAPAIGTFVTDPDEVSLRASLVATQMLGLALVRYVLRIPTVVDMTADELAAWVGPNVQRYIAEPNPAHGA